MYTVRSPFRVGCEKNSPQSIFFTLAPLLMLATNIRYVVVMMRNKLMLIVMLMKETTLDQGPDSRTDCALSRDGGFGSQDQLTH